MKLSVNQRQLRNGLLITLCFFIVYGLRGQQYPYQDPGLSSEERAQDLISRLTLAEKAALLCDESEAIPRLGIKKFNWAVSFQGKLVPSFP